jgi:CheY-like chemotaxis protein
MDAAPARPGPDPRPAPQPRADIAWPRGAPTEPPDGAFPELEAMVAATLDGLRVLIAEDDEVLCDSLGELLTAAGCEVACERDGYAAAMRTAAGWHCDVLLTDLDMPVTDGATLIRILREHRPWLPVVVLTGAAPPDGTASLTRPGEAPIALLNKPVAPSRLRFVLAWSVSKALRHEATPRRPRA